MTYSIVVRAVWDDQASVWVAESPDVPGLVAEADTLEALREKLQDIIPDLIELNGTANQFPGGELPLAIMAERVDRIRLRS